MNMWRKEDIAGKSLKTLYLCNLNYIYERTE